METNADPTLLVITQDLQLDREVNLANANAVRHREHDRGEVQNARNACAGEAIGGILCRCRRRRDHTDADLTRLHDLGEIVDMSNTNAADHAAHFRWVDIDHARDRKAALAEAAVSRKRLAEIACTNDDDRPIVRQTEFTADLIHQECNLVADASSAIAAEIGQVLANLGGVDAGEFGEALATDVLDLFGGLFDQNAQVYRKPGNGGLGDSATSAFCWHAIYTLGTRARVHKVRKPLDTNCCARQRTTSVDPMTTNAAFAAAATLVALAFALSTLDRWLRRRRMHELAWSVSLGFFTLGGFALWWAEAHGWGTATFRVFFLTGAVLNVPWLALGTVYLLAGRVWGDRIRVWLIALSGIAAGVVLSAPTKIAVSGHDLPKGSEVFGVAPRVFAAVGSGIPAIVIIGGALWSAWRVARGNVPALGDGATRTVSLPGRLALGNVLIAVGTLVLSASGTVAGRLGKDRAFAVTLLVGICVLFAGFLVASSATRRRVSLAASHERAA